MLNFDGEFDVNARSEDAYNYVSDPDRIAKLVPDLISYTKIDGNNMKLTAKAGVSFIKGKFDLDLKIINDEKKENLKLEGHGKGTGASVDFTVDFNFKQNDGMAHIKWNADVNVVGSAASMGGRMIKSAAGKYINKLIDAYKQALEAGN